jgi:SWI/SNF-related matrix-associated actin-dependent regulator of chromatin subfamily A member 5
LLSFLNPIFSDPAPFDAAFHLGANDLECDEDALASAHKLLRLFCLRRTKEDVEVSLPPLIETRVECPLSKLQTFWYRRLMLKDSGLLKRVESDDALEGQTGGGETWKKLQALFMQLRKVCESNHPSHTEPVFA